MDFRLDDYGFSWVAEFRTASWAAYRDASDAPPGSDAGVRSDGTVTIVFAPEGRDDTPLTADERALIAWFADNEPGVSRCVKAEIFSQYPSLQEQYGYPDDQRRQFMPDLTAADDLKHLIRLYAVNVHQVAKGGIPYLGFEFECAWDGEHGLGVLMHGFRAVEVGGSDTARLLWLARRDAGES